MIRANINEVKAKFSHYVSLAVGGETVVICNHNIPVAEIKSVMPSVNTSKKKKLGLYKENINLPEDFNETSAEIINSFYSTDNDLLGK